MEHMTKQQLINFEKDLASRYDDGQYPYLVHFSGGNEDELIDIFREVNPGDWVFSTHRSHYHYLLAGGNPDHLRGLIARGKSMFVFDRGLNFYTSSILAATPAIAAGVAWALKMKGSSRRVWCFTGDGAEDNGHLFEAVRYVDGHDLPCTFVVEDNDRSVSACRAERWGTFRGVEGKCVRRYHYMPTWPHGGTGTPGWLTFKSEAIMEHDQPSPRISLESVRTTKTYLEAVTHCMEELASLGYIFVGYNVRHGSAYGTLKNIPMEQRLETPVAENLMAGLAMGMTLEGYKSLLFFERHDFIYNAMDALVNQMCKVPIISDGQYTFPVIIKAVAGSVKPFYAGITHTSDITWNLANLLTFPVLSPISAGQVLDAYGIARDQNGPVLVSELKKRY